jgi:AAA+ superfamily predicted ATPase
MDTSDPKNIDDNHRDSSSAEEQLSDVFGSYKAEWLRERVFDYFTAPDYLPELVTARPCVLLGGRGTGKTTVLKGLSYEGQFALSGRNAKTIPSAMTA